MLESKFQSLLIDELEKLFPGCVVIKTDPTYIQGFPDLLILHNTRWAALEGKKSMDAKAQPNQPYYVELLNTMSYASFIYPENKEVVLDELQQALTPRRRTCISGCK